MQGDTLLIESKNARLFTIIYPKQNAETVIMLHGEPGVPMDYTLVAEALSSKYQVIAFDQRGTGNSPAKGSKYSMEEYIEDINVITQHFGVKEFHLFGHSWGGLYAQIYAEKYPERVLSMFLSSPSSGTGDVWKETQRDVLAFNKEHSSFWEWSKMGINSFQKISAA